MSLAADVIRSAGIRRRPRTKMPPQIYPRLIEAEYAKRMIALLDKSRSALKPLVAALPSLLATREDGARTDADEKARAKKLIDAARSKMSSVVGGSAIDDLASSFAKRTSDYHREQIRKQTRAVFGVEILPRDKTLRDHTKKFVENNVELIKSVPDRLHDEVEDLVYDAIASGRTHEALANDIEERFGVGESNAKRIAVDQIGKFYGTLNKNRQKEIGIDRFTWASAGDERVRDEHAELDGQVFSWDDLPTDEDGEEIYPGSPIRCRCGAEPVVEDVWDEVESDDEAPADESDD